MKIAENAVRRPLPTFLFAALIVVFGLYALSELPIKREPSIEIPIAGITVPYVGSTPESVESELTLELEDELIQLEGLRHLNALSTEGAAQLTIEFRDRVDVDEALDDVREAVRRAEVEFPADVEPTLIQEASTDDMPILQINLSGALGPRRLRQLAEDMEPALEAVPGVSEVEIFGGFEPEVRIFADPDLLAEYDLTLDELADQVRRQAAGLPGGVMTADGVERMVRPTGEFQSLDELRGVVIAQESAGAATLGDLAQVELHHKRPTTGSWIDGEPSVALSVRAEADVNTMQTVEELKRLAHELETQLPPGAHVTTSGDASRDISLMLTQLGTSAWLGLTLVLVVLVGVFGLRQALLVSSVLPFSLLFTFIGLYAFGMDVSNVSIFSLILVLGLVVDGAIVVGEAIWSEREEGASSTEAAERGIARVGTPVIAADLTTIAAFIPMSLMVGVMGQYMSVMPMVVTFAIAGSVFVDHFFIPAASARFGVKSQPRERPPWDPGRLREAYAGWLDRVLRHRGWLLLGSLGAFIFALVLVGSGMVESIFLPKSDRGRINVGFELPLGTPLAETNRVGRLLAEEVAGIPEVERYAVTTGGSMAAQRFEPSAPGPEKGTIRVELVDAGERARGQEAIADTLRARFENYAGVRIEVSEVTEGQGMGADLQLRVEGTRAADVDLAAARVEQMVRGIPGARDIRQDADLRNPELRVEVDRARARAEHSISPEVVSSNLLMALLGREIGRMTIRDERVDIRISAPESFSESVDRVRELPLRRGDGQLVPLGELARVQYGAAAQSISRHNTHYSTSVTASAATGYDTVGLTASARASLLELELPEGVSVRFGGMTEERERSLGSLATALKWGLLLIYCVLVLQFNSLLQPVIVMFCVPLSIVGVTIALLVTGTPFSFAVFIGVVSLTGIVVNDGIVMIDGINQARTSGIPLDLAVRGASVRRLRPVVLTTITTIAGIFPLTLNLTSGGEFWVPLGIAIIGGLLVASLLTLFVIPAAYLALESRLRSHRVAEQPAPPSAAVAASAGGDSHSP